MIEIPGLSGEVGDLAKTAGIVGDDGGFNAAWFNDPLASLRTILSNASQREAVLRLLDALLPPKSVAAAPANEKWHPLLEANANGNAYVTVREEGGGVVVGIAGDYGTPDDTVPVAARLSATLPLIRAGTSVAALPGTDDGPLVVRLRVVIDLVPGAGGGIALHAVSIEARATPSKFSLLVVLEGLSLEGEPASDRTLDPATLGREAPELVAGLLKQVVAQAGPGVAQTVSDLVGLLGLADTDVPAFPLGDLAGNPAAIQRWLASLFDGATPPIGAWLEHFAGLFQSLFGAPPAVATEGPASFSIALVPLGGDSTFRLQAARVDNAFRIGLAAVLSTLVDGKRIAFEAGASLADIPLAGTARARVVPQAAARLVITGSGGDLVPLAGGFRVGALRAGLAWNGSALAPQLELVDVHFANVDYPKLDLTNTDSVAAAASAAVTAAITLALGSSATALHIAALAGLVPPRDPASALQPLPGWTRTVDAVRLVADPTAAIAAIHRAALVDATQSWDHLFDEIVALLPGLPGARQGTGTPDDPWRVALGPAIGALELQLAAWNSQTSGNPADEQRLRVGLRLAAASPPITFAWLAEVLAFDLPASGKARVAFVGAQSARLAIAPAYDGRLFDDEVHATVASIAAQMSWAPGAAMSWRAGLENVRIEAGADTVTVASIAFPPAAGFDLANPAAAAASFGLTPDTLEKLVSLLIAQVASALGEEGREVAAFVGLHRFVEGLPDDWPTLANAGSPGRFLSDPLAALRDYLSRLFTTASADGTPFARSWIDRLREVFAGTIDAEALELEGAGTYDEPWKLPFPDTTSARAAHLLVWLDPAGPPNALSAGLSALANAVDGVDELVPILRALADHDDGLRARLHLRDDARIADGLGLLADLLERSDAVVPLTSQQPTVGGWTAPDPIVATHWALPRDPNAIDLVGADVDALAGDSAAPRAVLLLAPELAGVDPWSALLAAASIHGTKDTNARFALDDPSIPDALTFPLETVTAIADWYVGQLPDTDLPDWARHAQLIGRMVDRMATLRPGVPVTIVAHSTAGLAARHYTASNQAKVKGLITLGTPHVGANLPFLLDADIADAIRLASLMRTDLPAGAIRDAVDALAIALDGWMAPAGTGQLPQPARFPFAAFDATGAALDVGDVPVHTIGAITSADRLLDPLKAAVAAFATRIAAVARPTPTHVGISVAVALDVGTESDASDITAEAYVRADLVEIPLSDPAAAAPRPPHGLRFSARIARTDGWLLGGPGTLPLGDVAFSDPRLAFVDVRLRDFEIGLDAHASASGIEARPWVRLTDAALHGPTIPRVTETDAITAGLVGELFQMLSASADVVGAPATQLVDALTSLGVVGPDPHGGVGLSSDAWSALQVDAFGFVAARIANALARVDGWLGIAGPPEGPWTWTPPDAPFELAIKRVGAGGPYTLALRTSLAIVLGVEPDTVPSDQAGSSFIEEHVRIAIEVDVALPSLATSVQVSAGIGIVSLEWKSEGGTLTLRAPPWLDGLVLIPKPTAASLQAALSDLWPRLLFSGALSAALQAIAPTVNLARLEKFFRSSGDYLHELLLLDDGSLDVERLTTLIARIARIAGMPAGSTLSLPAGLTLGVDGGGTAADPMRVTLATSAPIAGVFEMSGGVRIDPALHVTPQGTVTLTFAIDGTWTNLGIRFGVEAQGVTLALLPGAGTPPIQLLPTFSGLGALRGAAEALLPRVLDEVVTAIGTPQPAWLSKLLDLATTLDLYANGFAARTAQLRHLLESDWFTVFDATRRNAIAQALVDALQAFAALPGTASLDGSRVRFALTLPAGVSGNVGALVGFDGEFPSVGVFADNVVIANVLGARLTIAAGPGGLQCDGRFGVKLDAIGVPVMPRIDFAAATAPDTGFSVSARPLATGTGDSEAGPLEIRIAPAFTVVTAPGAIEAVLTSWALPLVASTLIEVARAQALLAKQLWSSGPTVQDVLTAAQLVDATLHLKSPLPDVWPMLAGALSSLANGVSIAIGDLTLSLVSDAGRLGVGLRGKQAFDAGDLQISVLLGAPQSWTQSAGDDPGTPEAADGMQLFVLRTGGATPDLDVGLELSGVGIGIAGQSGRALVDDPSVHMGGVDGLLFMNIETKGSLAVSRLGGGLRIKDFGLPLNALTGGAGGGSNPVVTALLSQGGAGGDSKPANPGVDIEVWYREDDRLHVRMGGESGVLWIGVHSQFGPIYIDQVGVRLTSSEAGLLVDGGASLAGLTAQVDDLTLIVPYKTAGDPGTWTLDLKGLGIGFSQPGISIAGALVKYEPPIEYDGMLLIKIGNIGAIAVGSYSVPQDAGGDKYTSLAIFGGVFVPVGIVPIINLTAFGLGVGLNRRLIVPTDLNEIPRFMLVQALDDPGAIANDPLGALLRFRNAVPPSRGSFWIAIGLRGTSFEIVHVTAVLYVALDHGVEVGLLGLGRAALPADDAAIVCIELALKARFSTAEMLFSIQAQLTDNSWVLSHDCQLTGGYAYFMWFRESQFLLSLGGYHPSFQPRPEYPVVPRLGYRWNVLGVIHIKGESYFALTNTCVMAGMSMEVSYGPDWIQVWFHAHADLIAQWDPFYFIADIGISVGARFRMRVCFIGCVTISVSVSVGATLHVEGPPLHGTVSVDFAIGSVTIPFGPDARPKPPPISWDEFRLKYLQASDPDTLPVGVQVARGLLAPEPPGAPVAPGTEAKPWKLTAEWSFMTESRMPARGFAFVDDTAIQPWDPNSPTRFSAFTLNDQTYDLDIGPMNAENLTSEHKVFVEQFRGGAWQRMTAIELDKDRFVLEPRLGQVSEATFRVFGGLPPAAANTLPAVVGLVVHGNAELKSTTPDIIPIAKLRDATNPRPLPFAKPDSAIFGDFHVSGAAAELYLDIGNTLPYRVALDATARLLSGDGTPFAQNREASGVVASGLGPVAKEALMTRRSAAPLVAPLSAGLTMKPVDQPLPVIPAPRAPVEPIGLERPRLRAVMQARMRATELAPAIVRTTVSGDQRERALGRIVVGRDLDRRVVVAGARLEYVARPDAPRATRFAHVAASARNAEIGAATSRSRTREFEAIERAASGDGTSVRAGVTQLWDVPLAQNGLVLDGDQAVRVTLMSRGGSVIADREYPLSRALRVELPANCAMVAVSGLGRLGASADHWNRSPTTGAVTAFAAPAGRLSATGWQSSDQAMQLTATTLIVRGAIVRISERVDNFAHQQNLPHGVLTMAQATSATASIETRFNGSVTVVAIAIDALSARLPGDDDLEIAVTNASMASMPVRAGGGQRALMLFDVTATDAALKGEPIGVAVTSVDDVRISGVIGFSGTAREWGERLNGGLPEDWVPDEPLTPDGVTRVRFV